MFAKSLDQWSETETELESATPFEWAGEETSQPEAEFPQSRTRALDEFLAGFEAQEYESEGPKGPAKPGLGKGSAARGVLKYPSDGFSRQFYYAYYQLALQGTAGKKLTARQKAEAAEKIADAAMVRTDAQGKRAICAMNAVKDAGSKSSLNQALNLSGPWGDFFKAALQTTSGGDITPMQAANQAADIADEAVLASGQLEESLWKVFMKCPKS